MSEDKSPALRHLRVGDELIKFSTGLRAKGADFDHADNVIFVHGFTAHGSYLNGLAEYFDDNGFNSFIFNYNSYRGIEKAAETLHSLIAGINNLSKSEMCAEGILGRKKFSFVCHSMGGLVARAFTYRNGACQYINRVVTLGTPHSGTLGNSEILDYFLRWSEFVTEAVPGMTAKACLSAQELTSKDPAPMLLDRLQLENPAACEIPVLTISGGKQWLEFGNNRLFNSAWNSKIQRLLSPGQNDGLVSETSSSLQAVGFMHCLPNNQHYCDYPEFSQINHSNLINNQDLSIKMMGWLKQGADALGTQI
ncbi:alpha/beta fold hydrolase [Caballeronia sp. dw_276]|uniref:esterase/lipase family protein n=1 Tax=Caballeronia sp. dw_276 TaxID=2719795 RepID=UPI001BD24CBA|nr:alpha/beta fold hydrolase [Caballeronia sp. dw_276]